MRRTPCGSSVTLLILICALSANPVAYAYDTASFYFAAHEDDWQLFMTPNAARDVQASATKVIFVYTTAGDAGAGKERVEGNYPYYLARENGARVSTSFIADGDASPSVPSETRAMVAGHKLNRWEYRNTVSHFLRLPDGNVQGTGYPKTGWQSLRRLHEQAIASIAAIDDSAVYAGWPDLAATLRELIVRESGEAATIWINIADSDDAENNGDHSDHLETALAALDATVNLPCINRTLYVDYRAAGLSENLSTSDRELKAGTFAAVSVGQNAFGHPSNWDTQHRALLSRQYFRKVPATGACGGNADQRN